MSECKRASDEESELEKNRGKERARESERERERESALAQLVCYGEARVQMYGVLNSRGVQSCSFRGHLHAFMCS